MPHIRGWIGFCTKKEIRSALKIHTNSVLKILYFVYKHVNVLGNKFATNLTMNTCHEIYFSFLDSLFSNGTNFLSSLHFLWTLFRSKAVMIASSLKKNF